RHDILVGARKCFAEHGYEGATVRLLEEATGKSRGAIFHHFGDKEYLFLALAKEDTLRQAEVVAINGLIAVMREMLRHPELNELLAKRLVVASLVRTDPSFRTRWKDQQSMLDEAMRDRLRSKAEQGHVRGEISVGTLMVYLQSLMNGFI